MDIYKITYKGMDVEVLVNITKILNIKICQWQHDSVSYIMQKHAYSLERNDIPAIKMVITCRICQMLTKFLWIIVWPSKKSLLSIRLVLSWYMSICKSMLHSRKHRMKWTVLGRQLVSQKKHGKKGIDRNLLSSKKWAASHEKASNRRISSQEFGWTCFLIF